MILPRLFAIALLLGLLWGCAAPRQQQQDAEVHYILGVSYLQEQNPTLALKEFLMAVEFDPADPRIHAALAQAYQLKKAHAEAERHYLRALELFPDNPQIQNNLGALYLDMQRWDDAVRLFRQAASNLLFGNPEVALTGLGTAEYQKGNYLDAVAAYKEALGHNPRYAQAFYRMGEAYYALDRTELAIRELHQAVKLIPNYILAHYRLGLCYMKLRQLPEARTAFERVVELAPDSEAGQLSRDYLKLLQ